MKHYYKEEPLCQYCKRYNIQTSSILTPMNSYRLSVEEAVNYYWKHKTFHRSKYLINNKSVKSLLNNNKLYQKFCHKLYKSKDKDVKRIYEEIVLSL